VKGGEKNCNKRELFKSAKSQVSTGTGKLDKSGYDANQGKKKRGSEKDVGGGGELFVVKKQGGDEDIEKNVKKYGGNCGLRAD